MYKVFVLTFQQCMYMPEVKCHLRRHSSLSLTTNDRHVVCIGRSKAGLPELTKKCWCDMLAVSGPIKIAARSKYC